MMLQFMAERLKTGKDTKYTQYQKNLTKDINTTKTLHPDYTDQNVKKEEKVELDAGCWTR